MTDRPAEDLVVMTAFLLDLVEQRQAGEEAVPSRRLALATVDASGQRSTPCQVGRDLRCARGGRGPALPRGPSTVTSGHAVLIYREVSAMGSRPQCGDRLQRSQAEKEPALTDAAARGRVRVGGRACVLGAAESLHPLEFAVPF